MLPVHEALRCMAKTKSRYLSPVLVLAGAGAVGSVVLEGELLEGWRGGRVVEGMRFVGFDGRDEDPDEAELGRSGLWVWRRGFAGRDWRGREWTLLTRSCVGFLGWLKEPGGDFLTGFGFVADWTSCLDSAGLAAGLPLSSSSALSSVFVFIMMPSLYKVSRMSFL